MTRASRPPARPSEERPEQRPEVLERPRDEEHAAKSFAQISGGGRARRSLALSVNHLTAHAARPSKTPQLEAAEIEPAPNPVQLDSPPHLGTLNWGAQHL